VVALFMDFHIKLPGLMMMVAWVRTEAVAAVCFSKKQDLL